MIDRFICYVVLVVIPLTLFATAWRLLSIEAGLAIILGTALTIIVVGTVEYLRSPETYDRPGK